MRMVGKTMQEGSLCDCCSLFAGELIELPNGCEPSWLVCRGCLEMDAMDTTDIRVAARVGGTDGH